MLLLVELLLQSQRGRNHSFNIIIIFNTEKWHHPNWRGVKPSPPPPPLPFKWPHFSPLPPLPSLLYDVILFNWRNLYGTHLLTFNFFFCYLRSNLISIWKKRYESILMGFFLCGFNVTRVQFTAAFISVSGRKRSLWMLEDAGEVCGMLGGVWDAGRWGGGGNPGSPLGCNQKENTKFIYPPTFIHPWEQLQ